MTPRPRARRSRLAPWLLGGLLLALVVAASLHASEGEAFVTLARQAEPAWLAVAVGLQVATYVAQGGIWRLMTERRSRLSRWLALELSLAKLFVDQALPSGGLSGSILVAKALEEQRFRTQAARAAVLTNIASYYVAYSIALGGALVILTSRGETSALMIIAAALFLLFSMAVATAVLTLTGRPPRRLHKMMVGRRAAQAAVMFLADADGTLVRSPRVLIHAIALQLAIVGLDAATLWVLIASLGMTAAMGGVFASFMVASLVRTMGIMPGGLGTFEATSVLTLREIGVGIPVGLAATLLFRGLTFWLPMLPGYWCSHHVVAGNRAPKEG